MRKSKLNRILKNRVIVYFLESFGLSICFRILLSIFGKVSISVSLKEANIEIMLFFISSAIILGKKIWDLRYILDSLLRIYAQTSKETREPIIRFMWIKVAKVLNATIYSAFSHGGVELSYLDTDLITQLFFKSSNGIYNGTDSNPPSEFREKYPQYLAYQENNIKKKNEPGIRILLVTEKDLNMDLKDHQEDFDAFCNWHNKNSIELLQVDPDKAKKIASNIELPSTDLGIWDNNYAALFCKIAGVDGKLKLLIRPKESLEFDKCKNYFLSLVGKAKEIRIMGSHLNLKTRSSGFIEEDINKVRSQWSE